jgi:dTDP-4-amino-4,6-dideoxygalactose transaminase
LNRIYLSPPHMGQKERELLSSAFDSNWIAPLGPHVDAFEAEVAEAIGVPFAAALSSGTAALHLGLLLLGAAPGRFVITSSLTFSATANAIWYTGAAPVFTDCDPSSWTLDPQRLEEGIRDLRARFGGESIAAIVPVDLYGQVCDYESIEEIARRYEIPVLADAAEALGSERFGRAAGSFGAMAALSFNGNKIITTSGGGMLLAHRREHADRARFLATQARDPAPHYQHSSIGYNYRLSNLLAAVGRGQLQALPERVAARRANREAYRQALGDLPGIGFLEDPPRATTNAWLTCVQIDPDAFGADREAVRVALEAQNIESRPVWKPLHLQPVFQGCRSYGGGVAERLFRHGLCLPSGSSLDPTDRQRVIDAFRAASPRG